MLKVCGSSSILSWIYARRAHAWNAAKNRQWKTEVIKPRLSLGGAIVRVKGVFIQSAAPNLLCHINPYGMAPNWNKGGYMRSCIYLEYSLISRLWDGKMFRCDKSSRPFSGPHRTAGRPYPDCSPGNFGWPYGIASSHSLRTRWLGRRRFRTSFHKPLWGLFHFWWGLQSAMRFSERSGFFLSV